MSGWLSKDIIFFDSNTLHENLFSVFFALCLSYLYLFISIYLLCLSLSPTSCSLLRFLRFIYLPFRSKHILPFSLKPKNTFTNKSGETDLKAWVFSPPNHQASDSRPAIVFFFGGGWRQGNPAQFAPYCEYLAARGMVAITVDYRVANRHGVKAIDCVADAQSAIRWMRENAEKLGVDPEKIVASGGSAGGHLAAATATLTDQTQGENKQVSSRPNALALFNPAVVLAPIEGKFSLPAERLKALAERLGTQPQAISPYHHVSDQVGPTIIFHGTQDKTVPFESVELFQASMKAQGNRCELVGYKDEGHGFFNYGRAENGAFIDTLNKLDAFLVSLDYLSAPPISTVHR